MASNQARNSSSKAVGRHSIREQIGKGKEVKRIRDEEGYAPEVNVSKNNTDPAYMARSRELAGNARPKGPSTGAFEWQSTEKKSFLPSANDMDPFTVTSQVKEYTRARRVDGNERTEHLRIQTTKRKTGKELTSRLVSSVNDTPNMQLHPLNGRKYSVRDSEKIKKNKGFRAPPKEEGVASLHLPEKGHSKGEKLNYKLKEMGL